MSCRVALLVENSWFLLVILLIIRRPRQILVIERISFLICIIGFSKCFGENFKCFWRVFRVKILRCFWDFFNVFMILLIISMHKRLRCLKIGLSSQFFFRTFALLAQCRISDAGVSKFWLVSCILISINRRCWFIFVCLQEFLSSNRVLWQYSEIFFHKHDLAGRSLIVIGFFLQRVEKN